MNWSNWSSFIVATTDLKWRMVVVWEAASSLCRDPRLGKRHARSCVSHPYQQSSLQRQRARGQQTRIWESKQIRTRVRMRSCAHIVGIEIEVCIKAIPLDTVDTCRIPLLAIQIPYAEFDYLIHRKWTDFILVSGCRPTDLVGPSWHKRCTV